MQSSLSRAFSIHDLRDGLRGRVIGPENTGYDEARTVMTGGIDRRPAAIARVADAADVQVVVRLARNGGCPAMTRWSVGTESSGTASRNPPFRGSP